MSSAALFVWLMTRQPVHAIPRRADTVDAIAEAASLRRAPRYWAAVLDVMSACETGNAGPDAAGGCPGVPLGKLCRREDGARYCGPWMVRCELVPVGSTLREQAKIALRLLEASARWCPAHPLALYAG